MRFAFFSSAALLIDFPNRVSSSSSTVEHRLVLNLVLTMTC